MYGKVIEHYGRWHWRIYDGEDDHPVGISAKTYATKEECRQSIRAIRNATFLIYDEAGQIIAASWPFS